MTSRVLADELRAEVQRATQLLLALPEATVSASRGVGTWTRKEILGHLIDSAANNHQRFARAQHASPLVWPGYEQDTWVTLHAYRDRPWRELVDLWASLNRHVAHVVERIAPDRLSTACRIGTSEPATLEWLIEDYLRHMRHHLGQVLE